MLMVMPKSRLARKKLTSMRFCSCCSAWLTKAASSAKSISLMVVSRTLVLAFSPAGGVEQLPIRSGMEIDVLCG